MSETLVSEYQLLRQAIVTKQQITCLYNGLYRECCPYAIGSRNGVERVLVYQFAGESSKGLPLAGEWRCMDVNKIVDLKTQEGRWFSGSGHSRPQSCITSIDVEVVLD